MTTPAETQRRFAQLYNEVHAIYDMVTPIGAVQKEHGKRLTALERELRLLRAEHGAKLDQHTAKLDQHSAKLDQHTAILDQHTAILDQHTVTLDQHTVTLDQHTVTLDQHTVKLDEHGAKLDQILDLLRSGRAGAR